MSKVTELVENYRKYIVLPWEVDASPKQRVIFAVYEPSEERRLCASLPEFEMATAEAHHAWACVNLEHAFSNWLGGEKYRQSYFKQPQLIVPYLQKFQKFLPGFVKDQVGDRLEDANAVIVLTGTGALFSLAQVHQLVDDLSPLVKGRLLVMFPGRVNDNQFRLLDAVDGWGYLAVVLD